MISPSSKTMPGFSLIFVSVLVVVVHSTDIYLRDDQSADVKWQDTRADQLKCIFLDQNGSRKAMDTHSVFLTLKAEDVHKTLKNQVPKDTIYLQLSILEPSGFHTIMDITPLEQLKALKVVKIKPAKPASEVGRDYSVWIIFQSDLKDSLSIQCFQINLPMFSESSVFKLLSRLNVLQVLDFGGTINAGNYDMFRDALSHLEGKPLQVLSLRRFQDISHDISLQVMNLTSLLWPLRDAPLQYLDISENNLYKILPGFYRTVRHMKYIDLSNNNLVSVLNRPAFMTVLLHPVLEVLLADHQGPLDTSYHHQTRRSLHSSKHSGNSPTIFECMRTLNITLNQIIAIKEDFCKVLLCCAKDLVDGVPCEIIPPFLQVFDKSCPSQIRIPIGRNLRVFSFSYISWTTRSMLLTSKTTLCLSATSLEKFTFNHNLRFSNDLFLASLLQYADFKGLDNIKLISFNGNGLNFSLSDSIAARSWPLLRNLSLSNNRIRLRSNHSSLCQNNKLIQNLDLSYNQLHDIPFHTLGNCSHLTQLDLSGNQLSNVSLSLNGTPQLRVLNFSFNLIQSLSNRVMTSLKTIGQHHGVVIDLSHNPLSCDCSTESIATLEFILRARDFNITFYDLNHYECFAKYNIKLLLLKNVDLNEIHRFCEPSKVFFILVITASNMAVITFMILCCTLYKYRYRIYMCRLRCTRKYMTKQNNSPSDEGTPSKIDYDAFISYAAEDRFWVHELLMKKLEDKYGFKLCIHYRDFPVTGFIADVIIDHIRRSRSVVVILSEYTLKSQWCNFELQNAHAQSLKYHKPFVVIKMGKIAKALASEYPLADDLLSSRVYIEWPESETANVNSKTNLLKKQIFWEKLAGALYGQPGQTCCSCFKYCCACIDYNKYIDEALLDDNDGFY